MKELDLYFNEHETNFNDADKKYLFDVGYAGMFELILNQGLSSQFPNGGIPLHKGIILARIQRKLDLKDNSVELEEAEFDLVKEAFGQNAKFSATQFRLVAIYMEKIEQAKVPTPQEEKPLS